MAEHLGLLGDYNNPPTDGSSNLPTAEGNEAYLGDVPNEIDNDDIHNLTSSCYSPLATLTFCEVTYLRSLRSTIGVQTGKTCGWCNDDKKERHGSHQGQSRQRNRYLL